MPQVPGGSRQEYGSGGDSHFWRQPVWDRPLQPHGARRLQQRTTAPPQSCLFACCPPVNQPLTGPEEASSCGLQAARDRGRCIAARLGPAPVPAALRSSDEAETRADKRNSQTERPQRPPSDRCEALRRLRLRLREPASCKRGMRTWRGPGGVRVITDTGRWLGQGMDHGAHSTHSHARPRLVFDN